MRNRDVQAPRPFGKIPHAFGEKFPARVPSMFLAMPSAAAKSNKLEAARISNNGRMD